MSEEMTQETPVNQEETQEKGQKTFSAEYVRALRNESKNYRIAASQHEQALRAVLGIKDTEDVGDIHGRISAFQQAQEQREAQLLAHANERMIKAELKALEGYDTELLAALIHYDNITVDENGNVNGLVEAAEQVAERFPTVKKQSHEAVSFGASLENQSVQKSENQAMNEIIRSARR